MKIKSLTIILLVISFSLHHSFSQKFVKVKKSEFITMGDEEGYKEPWKKIKKGNAQFRREKKGAYFEALKYYQEAYKYNEDNAALNYLIGICYLKTADKAKALKYIKNAYDIKEDLIDDILYWKGLANQYNYNFKEAKEDYNGYLESIQSEKKLQKIKTKVDRRIAECDNGIELMKNPVRCFIDNLGEGVNTSAPEYSPIFFLSGDSTLYFTSKRENTTGGRKNPINQLYYEDVYESHAKNGKWGKATQMGRNINTKHNDAAVDISVEGKELCIYRGHKGGGDLFNSQFKNGKWNKNRKMRKIDKRGYRESSVSVSRDSMRLYFISNRKGGQGGQDIWYSERTLDGRKWQKPVNLGDVVNTKYDEETVEISSDNRTLFFSSKGHNSIGGYDIFKAVKNADGSWNKPVNLGYPINTPGNDVFFMLTPDEKFGYFASEREEGFGDYDIYQVVFLGPEKPTNIVEEDANEMIAYFMEPVSESDIDKPVNIKIIQLSMVKGVVTDALSGEPLKATLELVDNSTGKIVKKVETYEKTGAYSVPLPPGKDYALTAGAVDHFFHSENFVIADTSIHEVIRKDIELQPMGIGAKIVLNNVFFDTGKATLRPESYPELNRLISILKQYKRLVVEISGHTDSRGSSKSNQRLSQRRAQSVVDYIASQGVSIAQIQAVGYGEDQPRADNKTKAGRQLNRRVEAKIISK